MACMKILRFVFKTLLFIIMVPALYVLVSLILSWITVNGDGLKPDADHYIYLSSNGVHLSIILPAEAVDPELRQDLDLHPSDRFYAFGWGEKDFYLNTPQWSDLTMKTAIKALFFDSKTLIHLTRYRRPRQHWVRIAVDPVQLERINAYILQSFELSDGGQKQILPDMGYGQTDDFYKARGNYTLTYTCNTWVNRGFKAAGLPACAWTPFDFGLMGKYD